MKLCKFSFLMMSCVMAAAFVAGCSSSDTAEGTIGRAYDPSQPVKLLSFYPDSRPLQNLTSFSIILVFEHYWLTCSLYF